MNNSESNIFFNNLSGGLPKAVRGEGMYIYDDEGNRYIDGIGGLFVTIPQAASTLSFVAFVIAIGGLMILSPDAAVMAGQIALVATLLVVLMVGIRRLLSMPILETVDSTTGRADGSASTRSMGQVESPPRLGTGDVAGVDGGPFGTDSQQQNDASAITDSPTTEKREQAAVDHDGRRRDHDAMTAGSDASLSPHG